MLQVIGVKRLTSHLKLTDTPQQLLQLVRQYGSLFDHIHIAAALTQLGQWHKLQRIRAEDQHDVEQLLQRLEQLLTPEQLQRCKCRQLSNIIWACSLLKQHQTPLYQACLHEFLAKVHSAQSLQCVSNVLYSLAEAQHPIAERQLQQLTAAAGRQELLDTSGPQNISNAIWAIATLQQQVPEQQLQHMVASLLSSSTTLVPQDVSNTLWALAKLQAAAAISLTQLQQLEVALVSRFSRPKPMEVSNTLWACAGLLYFPKRLIAALQDQHMWDELIPAMKLQDLANTGLALGALGHRDVQLMGSILKEAVKHTQQYHQPEVGQQQPTSRDRSSHFDVQELCNLCWAAAVLDLQESVPQVLSLIKACRQQWDSINAMEVAQIHQVHLWLLDCQATDAQGLGSVLSEQQLQQCSSAWANQLQQYAARESTIFQADVFEVLLQLPMTWQSKPAMEQLSEPDGAVCIDISGVTAEGVKVAVEADGPTHFRRPDLGVGGSTLYRNRALAARGYVVVSVAIHEWRRLQGVQQQIQYLTLLLQQQLASQQRQQLGRQPARRTWHRHAGISHKQQPAAQHPVRPQSPEPVNPQHLQLAALTTTSGRIRRVRRRTGVP